MTASVDLEIPYSASELCYYLDYFDLVDNQVSLLQIDAGELDSEMLQLTQRVLSANPDYYTLWNIRRETIDVLMQTK